MLEVIDRGAITDSHPAPLLFVHGAWHAAWCWDEHFLDFFANAGFRAVAVSLRGHGASTSSKPARAATFADHVDDLQKAVDTLGCQPVLVGHSLGGLVVQKYLENHDAPAAVLMAPHPPQLIRRARVACRAVRRHPWLTLRANTVGTFADLVNTPRLARESFFCDATPEPIVESCAAPVESGSKRAGSGGMIVRVRCARITTPLLVIDGEKDAALTQDEMRATATAYGTQAEFFPNMGHNMMLEPGWRDVAERICEWLAIRNL